MSTSETNGPIVLCVANQKGGVGKTTTAINVSAALARRKKRVLLLDLDAQGNASSIFLSAPPAAEKSAYGVFKDRRPIATLLERTRIDGLSLLPANVHLAEVETLLAGAVDGFFRLSDSLSAADTGQDFVVVDCPPNLGLLTVNAFVSATHLLIPLQTAKFSLDGLRTMLDTSAMIRKRFNAGLSLLGALITMHNARTTISQAIAEPIEDFISLFKTRISRAVPIEEAHLLNQTIFEYQSRSRVAREYDAFTEELLNAIEKG